MVKRGDALPARGNITGMSEAAFRKLNIDYTVGRRLKQIRTERGLSLSAIARITGIDIRWLVRIELGQSGMNPTVKRQLAEVLDVPVRAWDTRYEDERTHYEREGPL